MAFRTLDMKPVQIPVAGADAEGGRKGEIRKPEIGRDFSHQVARGRDVVDLFAHKDMKYCPAGISGLKIILKQKGLEDVIRIIDRQLA